MPLAGAFLLNAIHIPSVVRLYGYGVIDEIDVEPTIMGEIYVKDHYSMGMVEEIYEERLQLPTKLETPVFIFDYDPEEEYFVA